jgi:hypothetical protein
MMGVANLFTGNVPAIPWPSLCGGVSDGRQVFLETIEANSMLWPFVLPAQIKFWFIVTLIVISFGSVAAIPSKASRWVGNESCHILEKQVLGAM